MNEEIKRKHAEGVQLSKEDIDFLLIEIQLLQVGLEESNRMMLRDYKKYKDLNYEVVAAAVEQVDKLPKWCTTRLTNAVTNYQED